MKALLVFALAFIIIPAALFAPFIGLNAYVWVAYLRPHEWAYLPSTRLSLFVALATLVGYVFVELARRPPKLIPNWMIVLLWVQLGISTLFAQSPEIAQPKFVEFSKTILIALLMTTLVDSEDRTRRLYLATVIAIGLLAARSTINVILTGGADRAYGPGGMFEDNNDYALLLVTIIPMMIYGGRGEPKLWLRYLCYGFAGMAFITVFFTRSRGGFIGLCMMLVALVFKSKYKITGLIGAGVAIVFMFAIVPDVVTDRLGTIGGARETDQSAQARLRVWGISMDIIADHPLTGVGPRNILGVYSRYGDEEDARVSHNAFLQIGVDAGIPAMILFVGIIVLSYWRLWRARSALRTSAPDSQLINYTYGLQAALVGYTGAAMFASRHDFELFYEIAALTTSILLIARKYQREAEIDGIVEAKRREVDIVAAPVGQWH